MVPPTSHGIPRVPRYSGSSWILIPFVYVALTLCGRPSHAVLLEITSHDAVRNPEDIATFGLASSAFARHYSRNLGWCLFLALLRCFSSGGSLPVPILFSTGYLTVGFPIRKSPAQRSFAAPRSLSQLITSFIGSWCQGIPLALLLAWPSSESASARSVSALSRSSGRKLRLASPFLLSNQNPLTLVFWFVGDAKICVCLPTLVTSRIIHFWFL